MALMLLASSKRSRRASGESPAIGDACWHLRVGSLAKTRPMTKGGSLFECNSLLTSRLSDLRSLNSWPLISDSVPDLCSVPLPPPDPCSSTTLYFRLKPLIPRPRSSGRSPLVCTSQAPTGHDVWPIMPGSEQPPNGWQGWPDGKKFAFVLTHDVESRQGLDRVKELAEPRNGVGLSLFVQFHPRRSIHRARRPPRLVDRPRLRGGCPRP